MTAWDRSREGEQTTICGPELLTLSNAHKGQRCTLLGVHREHDVALVETEGTGYWVLVPVGCLVFADAVGLAS